MNLRSAIESTSGPAERWLWGRDRSIALSILETATFLQASRSAVAGRSVMLLCDDQLTAAVALADLDGLASRILLCPPDVQAGYLAELASKAEIDTIVGSHERMQAADSTRLPMLVVDPACPRQLEQHESPEVETHWLLLTSGTSGIPKIVQHTFEALTAAMPVGRATPSPVWSTFYDIRRYGGLQMFLRAMTSGGSMVLSDAHESVGEFIKRVATNKVTHISGTPSHWRRAIMSGRLSDISPGYVRMSGEIADQAIIDALKTIFPDAPIAHAYASTEAGVGFSVDDGLAGFPASLVEGKNGKTIIRVVDDTLRIRSVGAASRYVGPDASRLIDSNGFVDTGDVVERRGNRYYFVGRRGGIINIGGLKIHPEEVEAVLNRHDAIQMSLVKPRKNPVTGSIIVADVVLAEGLGSRSEADLKSDILEYCRTALPVHKVPALLKFVPTLNVAQSGKLVRTNA